MSFELGEYFACSWVLNSEEDFIVLYGAPILDMFHVMLSVVVRGGARYLYGVGVRPVGYGEKALYINSLGAFFAMFGVFCAMRVYTRIFPLYACAMGMSRANFRGFWEARLGGLEGRHILGALWGRPHLRRMPITVYIRRNYYD